MAATATRAGVLRIHGDDAGTFAQQQFSSDVATLAPNAWQWSAWLDAQGRVLGVFQLGRDQAGALHALVRGGDAAALANQLRRYVFRARLTIDCVSTQLACAREPLEDHSFLASSSELRFGAGPATITCSIADDVGRPDPDASCWKRAAIAAGHPWLPEDASARFLPPALGLYRLGAVSTRKGCYPGQEMVQRLARGGHKHHLHHFRGDVWREGETIMNGDAAIGTVLLRSGDEVLAVVRDEALSHAGLPPRIASFSS